MFLDVPPPTNALNAQSRLVRLNGRREFQNALRCGVHLHTTHRYCNLMLEAVVPRRNTGFIPVTPNAITVAH